MKSLLVGLIAAASVAGAQRVGMPDIVETRAIKLTQTVTLADVPAGAKKVQLWVPVPSDAAWQRVVDRQVTSAPGKWRLVRQAGGAGDFVYAEVENPPAGLLSVVVDCVVDREGVHFKIDDASNPSVQKEVFPDSLNPKAPLMEVNERTRALADKLCGNERDPARQAALLMKGVAAEADHYSKDASKPKCGRGSAEDCMDQGGGCCTDLHSLFIAMARARGIPARIQYGYRALDAKAGSAYDPGYRCWAEFFVSGSGWVPNDIVASDAVDDSNPYRWASLSSTKVWLWEGRSFELTPPARAGSVNTMICGWAEIDGKPVDVLPGSDGSPSKLTRKIQFDIIQSKRPPQGKLPD